MSSMESQTGVEPALSYLRRRSPILLDDYDNGEGEWDRTTIFDLLIDQRSSPHLSYSPRGYG